jgi:hypothetical protein
MIFVFFLQKDTDASEDGKSSKKAVSRLGVNQFKTIPPLIKNELYAESNLNKIRKARDEKKLWKKPLPPMPFLLHLNVIARTNYMDKYLDFAKSTKNDCEKYVDPLLGFGTKSLSKKTGEPESSSVLFENKLACNEEENEAVEFLLAGLLRDLVSDKSFHTLVQRTKSDEIPFFVEYAQGQEVCLNY